MPEKTIAERLLVKAGSAIWISDQTHAALLGELPGGATHSETMVSAVVAVLFGADAASLEKTLAEHETDLGAPAAFWVAYPKANRTDINRDTIWPILARFEMRPISQVAIDEASSALRFRKLKAGEAPFTGGNNS